MNREKCADCRYGVQVDMGDGGAMLRACQYILKRGARRPCPPGEACAVWEPASAGREESIAWAFSDSRG